MGLSQTLPVTSYFKMIDIWMLFTMTVPFLEVVLHTTKEVFKKSGATPLCLNKRVDVKNWSQWKRSSLATTFLT